jgi:tetratricopeptide (TPR) repeat protein
MKIRWPLNIYSFNLFPLLLAVMILSAACSSKGPTEKPLQGDPQLDRLNRSAHIAFEKADYVGAESLYRQALQMARMRNAFSEIVEAHFNLALGHLKQGDVAGAETQLQEAKTEFSREKLDPPPKFFLLEAVILYREGRKDEALAVTDAILKQGAEPNPEVLGRTYYLRGRIAADRGDTEGIRTAVKAMGAPDKPPLIADLEELKGHVAFSERRWAAAATAFDRAADLQRQLLNYRAMAAALAMAARALEYGNRPEAAADRYFQAGRSAALQGEDDRAREWLIQAMNLAENTGDRKTVGEARKLLSNMELTEP